MNEPTPRTPKRRMYVMALLAGGASAIAAWRSLGATWVTFQIDEQVTVRAGQPAVPVSASQSLDAAGIAAVTGVEWFGFPRPLVLLAVAALLALVGVALRLWILPAGAAIFVLPAAWSQQSAIEALLLRGPGGQYVTPGPGLGATGIAMALMLAMCLTVTFQVLVVRRWEVAEARAEALAKGETPVPTTRELFGSLVANRIRIGSMSRAAEASPGSGSENRSRT